MEHSSNFLHFAANVAMVCAFIASVVLMAMMGANRIRGSSETVSNSLGVTAKSEWEQCAGSIVLGDRVVYLMDTYADTAFIRVVTKKVPTGFFVNEGLSDSSSEFYVDRASNFLCSLLYSNGHVIGLQCEELGSTSMAVSDTAAALQRYNSLYSFLTGEIVPEYTNETRALQLKTDRVIGDDSNYSLFCEYYSLDKQKSLFSRLNAESGVVQ